MFSLIGFVVAIIIVITIFKRPTSSNRPPPRSSPYNPFVHDFYREESNALELPDNPSSAAIKHRMDELQSSYRFAEPFLGASDKWMYEDDIEELLNLLHMNEFEHWENKARPHLDKFSDSYIYITNPNNYCFEFVELLFKEKKSCLTEYRRYFAVDITRYETVIDPLGYLRETCYYCYDPCMESVDALNEKLSECVAPMLTVLRRKKRLFVLILDFVYDNTPIARSVLFKVPFDGYSPDEFRCCYRTLKKENRVVETKDGSRWFVSLSPSELSKKRYSKPETLNTAPSVSNT